MRALIAFLRSFVRPLLTPAHSRRSRRFSGLRAQRVRAKLAEAGRFSRPGIDPMLVWGIEEREAA